MEELPNNKFSLFLKIYSPNKENSKEDKVEILDGEDSNKELINGVSKVEINSGVANKANKDNKAGIKEVNKGNKVVGVNKANKDNKAGIKEAKKEDNKEDGVNKDNKDSKDNKAVGDNSRNNLNKDNKGNKEDGVNKDSKDKEDGDNSHNNPNKGSKAVGDNSHNKDNKDGDNLNNLNKEDKAVGEFKVEVVGNDLAFLNF